MGSINWKITAKVVCKTFDGRIILQLPHNKLLCYIGQQNGYISNVRTPNVQWHVGLNMNFIVAGVELDFDDDFDIWLTFEPTCESFGQKTDDWDEEAI